MHTVATKLRLTTISQIGVTATCAVLRITTRHGRLCPGLAPKIEGPTVNSEKSESTPPAEMARMMNSEGKAESPYL